MENITKEEFLQGLTFTHKFYEERYKYGQTAQYNTYLIKQGGLMETVTIHTITESSFVVNELMFDVSIDVVVLFADCFKVKNQLS